MYAAHECMCLHVYAVDCGSGGRLFEHSDEPSGSIKGRELLD